MWVGVTDLARRHPSLRDAASNARDLALGSNADRSVQRYLGVFRQFVAFCRGHGLQRDEYFPATAAVVATYVQHINARGLSPASVRIALAALSWVHVTRGFTDPCRDPTLRLVAEGAQRDAARPVRHALPLSPEFLADAVEGLLDAGTSADVQLAAMMSVAFAAFLRISELLKLAWCDVTIRTNGSTVAVFLDSRKNDQERRGDTRLLPADVGSGGGLLAVLRQYALTVDHPFPSQDAATLWPRVVRGGRVDWTAVVPRGEAYAALRAALRKSGVPGAAEYSWHSLRAGAATSASNRGISEPVTMTAGGWKSAEAARTYVHHSEAVMTSAVRAAMQARPPVTATPVRLTAAATPARSTPVAAVVRRVAPPPSPQRDTAPTRPVATTLVQLTVAPAPARPAPATPVVRRVAAPVNQQRGAVPTRPVTTARPGRARRPPRRD